MLWLFRHSFAPEVVRYLSTCLFVVNTGCSELAPRQQLMFWSHTLKERGIVIFAWFQCFVCFERPSCFGHTHTCIGSVFSLFRSHSPPVFALCLLFSLFAVNECNFRIDKSIIRIVVKIIQSYGSNESTNLST